MAERPELQKSDHPLRPDMFLTDTHTLIDTELRQEWIRNDKVAPSSSRTCFGTYLLRPHKEEVPKNNSRSGPMFEEFGNCDLELSWKLGVGISIPYIPIVWIRFCQC